MSNNSVGPVLGPENFQLQPSSQQGDEEEDVLGEWTLDMH